MHIRIKNFTTSIIIVLTVLIFSTSCSRSINSPSDPVTPELPIAQISDNLSPDRFILGSYLVSVNVPTQNVEITPTRNAFLDMQVNLNPYMLSDPCQDCLRLDAISLDNDGNLLLDFALTHAFQDVSVRPDLNGFDLRGILVLPGHTTFPLTPKVKPVYDPETHQQIRSEQTVTLNPGVVKNADGYTPIWDYYADLNPNFSEIPGNLNPFINYFWEDNPDPLIEGNPIPWRTFAVGGGWDVKRYVIDLSKLEQTFQFFFIADVGYGQSATWQTRQNPFYRNPQFNRKEAYAVTVELDNHLMKNDASSYCDLTIYVKNWQEGAPLVQDPENPGQNEIDAVSDVKRLTIEAPDLMPGLLTLDTPDSGSGSEVNPFVFTTRIRNMNAVPDGIYYALIAVEDTLNDVALEDIRAFKVVELEVKDSYVDIEFKPPVRVTYNEHASFLWPKESIAIDRNNNPHIVWTDNRTGYHEVYYIYRNPNGQWSEPENISQSTEQAFYATIAIDSLNRGHIVWEDSSDMVEGMDIYYGLKTGEGLEHKVNLTNFDDGMYGYFPRVVTDSSDRPHIVWEDNRISGDTDNFDVRYVRMNLSGATPVQENAQGVGVTDAYEGQPMIAINPSDDPRIAMIRKDPDYALYHAKMTGSNFGEPNLVNEIKAFWPHIDIAPSGAVTVAFHGGSEPYQIHATYSLDDGNNWASLIQISEDSSLHQLMPDIAFDTFGITHILWHELDQVTQIPGQIKYRQFAAGELSDEQAITPEGYPSAFPSVAADHDNHLHVAVQTWIDNNYEIFYLTSRN